MARKNAFTKLGRPFGSKNKAQTKFGAARGLPDIGSTTAGLQTNVPGAAFRRGGSVRGYTPMPSHHDDGAMLNLKRRDC
jgi:hypothetical protein